MAKANSARSKKNPPVKDVESPQKISYQMTVDLQKWGYLQFRVIVKIGNYQWEKVVPARCKDQDFAKEFLDPEKHKSFVLSACSDRPAPDLAVLSVLVV